MDIHVFEDPGAWYRTLLDKTPSASVSVHEDPEARTVGFVVERPGESPQALLLAQVGWKAHSSQWAWTDAFPKKRIWHGPWKDEIPAAFSSDLRTPAGRRKLACQFSAAP